MKSKFITGPQDAQQAASILAATISEEINVNISYLTLGEPEATSDGGILESCSLIRADLINGTMPGLTAAGNWRRPRLVPLPRKREFHCKSRPRALKLHSPFQRVIASSNRTIGTRAN
jgi:hypothetical protein